MPQTRTFPQVLPELTGATVCLRELTEADIPPWFERATDVESAYWAGDPVPESIEAGTTWLERHRERFRQQAALRWAIVPRGHIVSVGTVGLTITSVDQHIAELGIVLGRAYWGKGIGTSALRLVLSYGFGTLGLAEIRADVFQRNLASVRLFEKVGFQLLHTAAANPESDSGSETSLLYALRSSDQSAA